MSELQKTFSIIKPDAVASGKAGKILALLEENGFRVVALRMTKLSQSQAEGFYAVHRERPFYASLVKFMTEGPVIVMALERADAVKKLREVMGATNPGYVHPYAAPAHPRALNPGPRVERHELREYRPAPRGGPGRR